METSRVTKAACGCVTRRVQVRDGGPPAGTHTVACPEHATSAAPRRRRRRARTNIELQRLLSF